MGVKFLDVISVMEGPGGRGLDLEIKVDEEGRGVQVWPFYYVPTDSAPVTLAVKQWLAEHPGVAIRKRPPVPLETIMLSRRNVREAFVSIGLPADAVDIALAALPDGTDREMMRLSWLEDQSFTRNHPAVAATIKHWSAAAAALDPEWRRVSGVV